MRTRSQNLDLAGLPTGHDRLAPASADDLIAASMCSDWTTTHVLSQLVRGADISRGTRFVNQKSGARRSALAPTVAVTSFVAPTKRSSTGGSPPTAPRPHRRGCPDPDDLRRAIPGN